MNVDSTMKISEGSKSKTDNPEECDGPSENDDGTGLSEMLDKKELREFECPFKSVSEFFDTYRKMPRKCDGMSLEVLIRDIVNDEVQGIRTVSKVNNTNIAQQKTSVNTQKQKL